MVSVEGVIQSSSAIQQSVTANQVDMAVAKKTLDAHKQAGEAAVQLIESAAKISLAPGKGSMINTVG
ncbi:MAG: YjfB family protein [Pirellulaceae bacterium]